MQKRVLLSGLLLLAATGTAWGMDRDRAASRKQEEIQAEALKTKIKQAQTREDVEKLNDGASSFGPNYEFMYDTEHVCFMVRRVGGGFTYTKWTNALTLCLAEDLADYMFGTKTAVGLNDILAKYPFTQDESTSFSVRSYIMQAAFGIRDASTFDRFPSNEKKELKSFAARLKEAVVWGTNDNNLWSGRNNFVEKCRANKKQVFALGCAATCIIGAIIYGIYHLCTAQPDEQDEETADVQGEQETKNEGNDHEIA